MIRGAIVHVVNEQPLRVDLQELPSAADACLMCTNVRLLNGQRPGFLDAGDSWVLLPLQHVRFVEIPASAMRDQQGHQPPAAEMETTALSAESELPLDQELLRRIRET